MSLVVAQPLAVASPPGDSAFRAEIPWGRLGMVITAWIAACSVSLSTLAGDFEYQSVLAELIVVPVLGTGLVFAGVVRHRHVWAGRLGQGDLVAGVLLLMAAVSLLLFGRLQDFNGYWLKRPDLLAVPLILAAFLVLMLGMRSLATCAYGLLFTSLAWPYPFTLLNEHVAPALTSQTFKWAALISSRLGTSSVVTGGDHVLQISGPHGVFQISVATACSGINSVVAYALMALAALYLLKGKLLFKLLWLVIGVGVTWVAAVGRVVLLTVSGHLVGPSFTLGLLHASAALGLDIVVFLCCLSVVRRFGLDWKTWTIRAPARLPGAAAPSAPRPRSVVARAVATLMATLALLAMSDSAMGSSSLANDYLRNIPSNPVSLSALAAAGVDAVRVGQYDWSKEFFGTDSLWVRYRVAALANGPSTVYVDSVVVDDQSALRVHSVLSCYKFHDVDVRIQHTVTLPHLVQATELVVRQPDGTVWHSVYWQWPLVSEGRTRYERVTLLAASSESSAAVLAQLDRHVDASPVLSAALVRGASQIVLRDLTVGAIRRVS